MATYGSTREVFGGRVRYEEFGLETVMRSHNSSIKTRNDVLVIWLHYVLLRNLFKTYGGEGAITNDKTEQLPRNLGWNGERRLYLLKYEFGNRAYALGIFIRKEEADCSLVTLNRSLRIGIPVYELIREDLSMRDAVVDTFTEVIEKNFVWPMATRWNPNVGSNMDENANIKEEQEPAESDQSVPTFFRNL